MLTAGLIASYGIQSENRQGLSHRQFGVWTRKVTANRHLMTDKCCDNVLIK